MLQLTSPPGDSNRQRTLNVSVSMQNRSFYYTLLYTLCIGWFGLRRVLRRRTAYITLSATGRLVSTQWRSPGLKLAF